MCGLRLAVRLIGLLTLCAITNPKCKQHADANSYEEADESLGDRSHPAEPEPSWRRGVLDVSTDEGDDVSRLRRRERAGLEARHVARAGNDRLGDVRGRETVQRKCDEPARKCVTCSGDR